MTKFENELRDAFLESRYELSMQNRKTDKKFKKASKEYDEKFEKVQKLLGKDYKHIYRIEELLNQMGSTDDEFVYLQGMIDRVKLLRVIKML